VLTRKSTSVCAEVSSAIVENLMGYGWAKIFGVRQSSKHDQLPLFANFLSYVETRIRPRKSITIDVGARRRRGVKRAYVLVHVARPCMIGEAYVTSTKKGHLHGSRACLFLSIRGHDLLYDAHDFHTIGMVWRIRHPIVLNSRMASDLWSIRSVISSTWTVGSINVLRVHRTGQCKVTYIRFSSRQFAQQASAARSLVSGPSAAAFIDRLRLTF